MTTTIHSNGSKWAGQQHDTIADLLDVLGTYALDRTFEDERFGNFIYADEFEPNAARFFGNFLELSHVFNISTDDAEIISSLTVAIRANQQRPDYLSQRTYSERQAECAAHEKERQRKRLAEEKRKALILLGMEG